MMKKTMYLALLFSALSIASCNNEKKEAKEENDEVTLADKDVPGAVMKAFTAKYPDAKNAAWNKETEDGKTVYEAAWKTKDAKKVEAEFDEKGDFIKEE